ncbi:MAG: hypothetical protein QME60_05480 [Verrucomicrobiota bacterium]|nr:hypothetical protein [Verrucomicrobiota bacterium]
MDVCDNLVLAQWLELTNGIVGNDAIQCVVETNDVAPPRFYRIRARYP